MIYCKNCGNQLDDHAAFCPRCGVAAGYGTSYCGKCGAQLMPGAVACTQCGVAANQNASTQPQKSRMAAGLLGIFLGGLGVHNFYLGFVGKGIAQIALSVCLFGSGAIWGFIEGILILTGSINQDADGRPLKD